MGDERLYTSRRQAIVKALVSKFKRIKGQHPYNSDIEGRVFARLKFWDEVEAFPSVHVTAGSESRDYQGGGYKDRFMTLTVRCYVQEENAIESLEGLLEDLETVIEENSRLSFLDKDRKPQFTQQISIVSLDTDEGVLEPLGAGEIVCIVRY